MTRAFRPFHIVLSSFLLFLFATVVAAQKRSSGAELSSQKAEPARAVEIVQNGGYPELRIDGEPFFVHSAAFFYYRIPRDLWESSLDRHSELGINTIDLYIPWNWHEPREGDFDFEGRTNPRCDLRTLLKLITEKGFKLIARPGPVILNEWRHGGYPEWLLERPEYNMRARDRLEGRYPPLSNRNARDAEGAAQGWLDNATHMAYSRKWLTRVAQELLPYTPRRTVRVAIPNAKKDEPKEAEVSGPLLFVQLDDDMAIGRTNYAGPAFWRYMDELRLMLEAGGLEVPFYINPTDMRVSAAGFALERPIGAMGQWYLQQPPAAVLTQAATQGAEPAAKTISPQDAAAIEFFVEELKTQPAFPPVIIEYQAGWYTPGDDARPVESPPVNTLLSSRLLLSHGLHGLNYFPLQDTLTPAGYDLPWSNRYYRWDAALDPGGNRQPRARAVDRNGWLMESWGAFLASSHKRADFGIVYPLGAYAQEKLAREDIQRVSQTVIRLERLSHLAALSSELLDPQYQPVEQFLRHPLILLPVADPAQEKFLLSEKAQRVLVEYVRRGGTLVYFPARPAGKLFEELWADAATGKASEGFSISLEWKFGQGRVFECAGDFYSWVSVAEGFDENLGHPEFTTAVQTLRQLLELAGTRPVVKRGQDEPAMNNLLVTQLVSNTGTGLLGGREGGRALMSVTNLGDKTAADATFQVLSPRQSSRGAVGESYLPLRVTVPAGESLLLPVHFPLCAAVEAGKKCADEVVIAGAELLRAERDGKTLELLFYASTRAQVLLKLERQPVRAKVDERNIDGKWTPGKSHFTLDVPRGAAPDYLRLVKIQLPYTPHAVEKPDLSKIGRRDYDYSVLDSVRLPLAGDASLKTWPPLVELKDDHTGRMVMEAKNYDELGRDMDFKIEGPIRGEGGFGLDADEVGHKRIQLKPKENEQGSTPLPYGVLQGELQVKSGRDLRNAPIAFLAVRKEGVTAYQYDFDRDGAVEWVLEDEALRLVISPEAGGRAVAFVDKESHLNATTSVGALRDHFAYTDNPAGTRPERAPGRAGLFNRLYDASWVQEEKNTALRLEYEAPDVFPAGARIQKIVRLTGPQAFEVDYQVTLAALQPSQTVVPPQSAPQPEQAFVAVNSVPVVMHGDRTTKFCWQLPAVQATIPGEKKEGELHCETFVPGGPPLSLPGGVTQIQVRTPGSFALSLEWKTGRMTVEMKQFSALLKLQFPPLVPGGEAGNYQVKHSLTVVE